MNAVDFKPAIYGTSVRKSGAGREDGFSPGTTTDPFGQPPRQPDPAAPEVVVIKAPDSPPQSYLHLAIFSFLFCPIFGLVAIVCSLRSRTILDAGKTKEAQKHGKLALGFILLSTISGCAVLAVLLTMYLQCGHIPCKASDTATVCDPTSTEFDITACNSLTESQDFCDPISDEFNYYACFGVIHACNPQARVYDVTSCAKLTNDVVCSPFSPKFDLRQCADTEMKSPCNPFLANFDLGFCEDFNRVACSPLSDQTLVACFLSAFDPEVCQVASRSYDVFTCISKTVNSGPLAQSCDPLSLNYDLVKCISGGGLTVLSEECDPTSGQAGAGDCNVIPGGTI